MTSIEKQFKNKSLTQFLETLDNDNYFWLVKRLSGNDTGITGSHQAGIYIPRQFMEIIVPSIVSKSSLNPTKEIQCFFPSQDCFKPKIQAKYYNNKYFHKKDEKKPRNEFRFTQWGGTPLRDIENTGCICILAYRKNRNKCILGWVSKDIEEENLIESWLGKEVEPGQMYLSSRQTETDRCPLLKKIPASWKTSFPSGYEIFRFIEEQIPQDNWKKSIDDLLMKRRSEEFKVFSEVEKNDVLPNIKEGFRSVNDFIKYANSIANRRRSRSGASLELHLASIFRYEHLDFEAQATTEQRKRPDFLFPSENDYHNSKFPDTKLHMLASKTCCKDRWRQILSEANRINKKHLFTLQEGISEKQLEEMNESGVILVVPQKNIKWYPREYRSNIMNLTGFVDFIKNIQKNH